MDEVEHKKIVGLKYEKGHGLPRVILKGHGQLANEILRKRNEVQGPPVVKNERLVKELYRLPIDAQIGPELFELVAALLVHVYAIEGKLKGETA